MNITIINDCNDDNTRARQAGRVGSLFDVSVQTLGVSNYAEIEAAGNIIDVLDAYEEREGLVLVNAAPRHGKGKKWSNGTPFGYFTYKNTIVVTTIDGETLSLVKKLKLTDSVCVFDIPKTLDAVREQGVYTDEATIERINTSQFRSFDFEPRVAKWIYDGVDLPYEEMAIEDFADAPRTVWWVDNFGNCKTTLLPEEIGFEHGKTIQTNVGKFICYNRLKDVQDNESALIIGSSGIEEKRFLEIVVQGSKANEALGLKVGSLLEFN